ncbi:GspE/PulE family protein [Fimbriimonas ginsengisoli]|uniref:Type ii secretion system protein e n=1 Tax=Fimbriimonas ginsengisoli Gsoil 348 TaxID=661478 RepID=A0A068NK94_FIMGI|nr:ATPase, T2SS/T4P/T4SS family [Fimbriimonas ginsengisoli]AIE83993.1 type ii secretion system protein e [Fimbriimonas ginsengisoli Gsoil 348]
MRLGKGLLKRLGDRLMEDGMINDEQLKEGLGRQSNTGEFLGEALVALGFLSPAQIGPYMEEVTGFPFFDLSEQRIEEEIAHIIPEPLCTSRRVIAFRVVKGRVHVAMADPLNLSIVDEIRGAIDQPVVPYLAFPGDVEEAIRRAYGKNKAHAVLEEIRDDSSGIAPQETIEQLIGMAEDAPIVRLVHSIVTGAVAAGASDVHLEPQEDCIRVRYRIDGLLYEQMLLPPHVLAATMSRLKIMSNLDIAEKRRPQDGRFAMREDSGREFDVRLSLMPTVYGEKACMRLLEKKGRGGNMDKLGFLPDQKELMEKLIRRPHGVILVTGPTGSGKSTTLYSALQTINDPGININTVEDPVEYKLYGINQLQVNPRIGVTFAAGLRTLVRQDPDVILVGEIRDAETAEISVQAALTGHLVLSTLHTNDAPGALVRLQNMGVEPFLISSAVIGVVGQRLLRTTCSGCKEIQTLEQELKLTLGLDPDKEYEIARGTGCRRCGGRGSIGRTAIYEIMKMTDPLRNAVLRGASGAEISALAVTEGMQTMRETALVKMSEHIVSPEEVLRVLSYQE